MELQFGHGLAQAPRQGPQRRVLGRGGGRSHGGGGSARLRAQVGHVGRNVDGVHDPVLSAHYQPSSASTATHSEDVNMKATVDSTMAAVASASWVR